MERLFYSSLSFRSSQLSPGLSYEQRDFKCDVRISACDKKDLPDFSIEKGTLQADQSTPIEKEENGITIIFDPAEKIKSSELESKQTAIALLKEKAVIAIDGQMTDIPYQLLGGTLTKDELASVTNQNQAIIIPVICVLLYLSTAALMFISATFLAMLGTFIKRMQQKELSFQMLWKLSAYSLTLTTVFFAIMSALNTPVANSFLLNWVINFIFLYLVVKEIPAKNKLPHFGELFYLF
ncbi:DUF1189 domain-containing protein [Bacillus sp. B6(2022)]|nr:DUF1189 domain-containing protein [Bacillus sp. B6(2022)]